MRENAPDCGITQTYTREAERTQGQTHMNGCVIMQINAQECVRMRKNASDWGITHTYTREAERTQGQTWTDMGWTGCGRARRRANVAPMCHYMPSKSSSDSFPFLFDCVIRRLDAGYVWRHTNALKCNSCRMQRTVNALECVRMRVRQNATCRQNAPYVWRYTNAFKCNSCRMQHGGNAQ